MESLPLGTEVTLREACFSSLGSLSWLETWEVGMHGRCLALRQTCRGTLPFVMGRENVCEAHFSTPV